MWIVKKLATSLSSTQPAQNYFYNSLSVTFYLNLGTWFGPKSIDFLWKYKSRLAATKWNLCDLKVQMSKSESLPLLWYLYSINPSWLLMYVIQLYIWMYAVVYLNTNPQATYFPNLDWHFQMTNPLSNNCTIQYLFCILAPFDPYGLLCTVWLADTQSFCMR